MSTELANEYTPEPVLEAQAPKVNADFEMATQFTVPAPQPDMQYGPQTVEYNPELLTQIENATMLPEMAPSGGSFASDLFGVTCDALSAETEEVKIAAQFQEPMAAPIPGQDAAPMVNHYNADFNMPPLTPTPPI